MIKLLMKFALVGLSGIAVNLTVYHLLLALHIHYLAAASASFGFGVTNNFIWNYLWTFKDRGHHRSIPQTYSLFFMFSTMNLGLNLLVLHMLIHYLSFGETTAQLSAIALTSGLNFIFNHRITFFESKGTQVRRQRYPYESDCHTHVQ